MVEQTAIKKTKARLLVADDDRLVLCTMCNGLRNAGYEVVAVASGEECIQFAESYQPDLVILDMRMPGLSGLDVAEKLRDDYAIPFVFLSAFGDDGTVEAATELGALGYLVKPLDIGQVLPAVKAALRRAEEMHALREKETHLTVALSTNRAINTAIGVVMERLRVDRRAALQVLRERARSNRIKLAAVAESVLCSVEVLSFKQELRD